MLFQDIYIKHRYQQILLKILTFNFIKNKIWHNCQSSLVLKRSDIFFVVVMRNIIILSICLTLIEIGQSLPVSNDLTPAVISKSRLKAIESSPVESVIECEKNDTECERQRKKRQSLCEKNPGNDSLCGTGVNQNQVGANYDDDESEEEDDDSSEVQDIYMKSENGTVHFRGYVESAGANITTIIKLTNIIENKNYIDMPTILNNTNVNHIHVINNQSSEEGGKFGLGYTRDGPCCHLVQPKKCRQTTMGTQCRHHQKKVCGRECTHRVIKQRSKSKCIPQWPFFNNCNYASFPNPQPNYLQPQFVPMMPPGSFDDSFDDEDDYEDSDENDDTSLVKISEKCKVVSEDGTKINDCTDKIENVNPFARNSIEGSKKSKRHLKHADSVDDYENIQSNFNYQQQQQIVYYPVPVYIQSMPMMVPQSYQPKQSYYNYDDFDDDDGDDYEEAAASYQKRVKIHEKSSSSRKSKRQFFEEI